MRAKISFCRYSGRWSSNFDTRICARRPGPTIQRGIGREGAGGWAIFSQRRQDFFSRAISTTFSLAVISSRISLTSSPSRRRAGNPQLATFGQGDLDKLRPRLLEIDRGLCLGLRTNVKWQEYRTTLYWPQAFAFKQMSPGINLLPGYLVALSHLSDRRPINPDRQNNRQLLFCIPATPPLDTQNLSAHTASKNKTRR
jgi:hypothetical protein